MALTNQEFLKDIILEESKKESIVKAVVGKNEKNEDIVIELQRNTSNNIFFQYKDRADIADLITDGLMKKGFKDTRYAASADFKAIETNGGLFFLSDLNKVTGLLSVCPSLSSLLTTCYAMKINGNKPVNHKYDEKINYTLSYVLRKINPNYDYLDSEYSRYNGYVFDATPYVVESEDKIFTHEKSYLDTITWVILVLQTARDFAILDGDNRLPLKKYTINEIQLNAKTDFKPNEEEHKAMLKEIEDGIKACIRMTSDMAINYNENGKDVTKGWSFTNVEDEFAKTTESSLYFSYAATTVYLGLYKGFSKYIEIFRKIESPTCCFLTEEDKKEYWKNWEEICNKKDAYKKKIMSNEGSQLTYEQEQLFNDIESIGNSKIDEKNMLFLMHEINEDAFITNNERKGLFTKLRAQCLEVAADCWDKFKGQVGDHFVYSSAKPVDESAIENSGSSNELFNGLFVCGIILNSAYDMTLTGNDHDLLIDTLQACVQKTQRYYDTLDRRGESYKVNNYILQFVEKDIGNAEVGTILRKSSIKVSSLIPMLLKMNNLVSEYIIQYPQLQMRSHLVSIMKNRMKDPTSTKDNPKFIWSWESDEFQCISNYYYIDALNAFYNYYNKYEKQYITYDKYVKDEIIRTGVLQDSVKKYVEEIQAEETRKVEEVKAQNKQLQTELAIESRRASQGELGSRILSTIEEHLENNKDLIANIVIDNLITRLCKYDSDKDKPTLLMDKVVDVLTNVFMEKVNWEQWYNNIPMNEKDKYGVEKDTTAEGKRAFKEHFVETVAFKIAELLRSDLIGRVKKEGE